jgi:hypothetical protein
MKRTALGQKPTFGNCLWASWSCVAASSTHTKESHTYGRALALTLSVGGLLCYSILCGTVSATMRVRFETIAAGRDLRPVREQGHGKFLLTPYSGRASVVPPSGTPGGWFRRDLVHLDA